MMKVLCVLACLLAVTCCAPLEEDLQIAAEDEQPVEAPVDEAVEDDSLRTLLKTKSVAVSKGPAGKTITVKKTIGVADSALAAIEAHHAHAHELAQAAVAHVHEHVQAAAAHLHEHAHAHEHAHPAAAHPHEHVHASTTPAPAPAHAHAHPAATHHPHEHAHASTTPTPVAAPAHTHPAAAHAHAHPAAAHAHAHPAAAHPHGHAHASTTPTPVAAPAHAHPAIAAPPSPAISLRLDSSLKLDDATTKSLLQKLLSGAIAKVQPHATPYVAPAAGKPVAVVLSLHVVELGTLQTLVSSHSPSPAYAAVPVKAPAKAYVAPAKPAKVAVAKKPAAYVPVKYTASKAKKLLPKAYVAASAVAAASYVTPAPIAAAVAAPTYVTPAPVVAAVVTPTYKAPAKPLAVVAAPKYSAPALPAAVLATPSYAAPLEVEVPVVETTAYLPPALPKIKEVLVAKKDY